MNTPERDFISLRRDEATEFAKIVPQPFFRSAMIHAFAQFCTTPGVTTEQIAGVQKFIPILENIAEPLTPHGMPSKSLETF